MPSLSIIIPSHSRADLLALCLHSVQQHAPARTEIIVVDDASPDGIVSRTAVSFSGVRVVRLPRRSGFCVAANAGIVAATAPIVELLNDDTEVTAGWADAAVRWFADLRIAAVAPLVLQNDPARRALPPLIDSAGDEYDNGGFARKRGHGLEYRRGDKEMKTTSSSFLSLSPLLPFSSSNFDSSSLLSKSPVWGASATAAFYRRSALLAAGGFPEHFGAYFEDVDLSFRLRRLGYDIWYDPASVVWHRVSASYGKRPTRRVLEQQSCNEERVFWRNIRGRERVYYFPRHLAVLVGKALRRWQEGTFSPWATGRLRALCGR